MRVLGRETTAEKREIELLHRVYGRGVDRFMRLVSALSEERWKRVVGGQRPPQHALARLVVASSNGSELARAALAGRARLVPGDGDPTPDETSLSDLVSESPEALLNKLRSETGEHLGLLLSVADDDVLRIPARVPSWNRDGTLGQLFNQFYVQLVASYQDIRDRAGPPWLQHWFQAWMPEVVHDLFARAVSLVDPLIAPSIDGPVGGRVCLEVTHPVRSVWTLSLEQTGRVLAQPGCDGGQSGRISGKAPAVFDFLMGGRDAPRPPGSGMAVDGDKALARRIAVFDTM
ncbi:MAG: hypothetical protein GEU28_00635 [Dehalococcoidia bacterium]|nr:hypothetical protein [Dehalococcoidia bacterium]